MTRNIQRPAEAPRRKRSGFGGLSPFGLAPLVAAAIVVVVGVVWLGGRTAETNVGASPSPNASSVAVAPSVAPTAAPPSTAPTQAPPSEPAATPSPTPAGDCTLEAAITSWEGAAGSRIATIQLRNTGTVACDIPPVPTARLVDGSGRVLAQVVQPPTVERIELAPGEGATTDSSVANVCSGEPVPPVTIQFDFGDYGVVTAKPVTPTDAEVPPCNGPTQPSDMSIHPWSK